MHAKSRTNGWPRPNRTGAWPAKYDAGETRDLVQFTGAGLDGTVEVTADSFALHAQPGFLFSSFSEAIEQKVARNLDELLGQEAPPRPGWA